MPSAIQYLYAGRQACLTPGWGVDPLGVFMWSYQRNPKTVWSASKSKAHSWFSTISLTFLFSFLLVVGNFVISKSLASIPSTQAWLLGSMPEPQKPQLKRMLEQDDAKFKYVIFHQHVVAQQVQIQNEMTESDALSE